MGLFSDVKCGRCDRRYSGLRARCPYCGARRGKRGKHAKDYDNAKGRVIIGLILMVVLIVAVVVVIATNSTPDRMGAEDDVQQDGQGLAADSDGVTNLPGIGAGDTYDPGTSDDDLAGDDTTGDDTATGDEDGDGADVGTAINELYIVSPWSSDPQTDFTASVGDVIDFDYVSDPVFEDAEVLWETSDDNVFVILQTGEFTAIGAGSAVLSLTVNGHKIELNVLVRE